MNQTEIANLALRRFSQSRITDINQNSPAANAIRDVWDNSRRSALRAYPWNFAKTPAELAASATTPLFKWAYAYPLPVDFLRLLSCNSVPAGTSVTYFDIGSGQPYASDRPVLLSNYSTAQIEYIRDETEFETWSDDFVEAFSYKLAHAVAPALMADGGQAAVVMAQEGFLASLKAMGADASESKPRVVSALAGSAYQAARCAPSPGETYDWDEAGIWGLPAEYDVGFNPWNVAAP